MNKRILKRASGSSHDGNVERVFDRRVALGARLLARQPDLTEDALTRLLAAREGVDPFETVAAVELAFLRREALSSYLRARDEFLPGTRRVA